MNNEEKKQFLIDTHRLFMSHRPYDSFQSVEVVKEKEDAYFDEYIKLFLSFTPKSLYKYRKFNENSISNLENDKAWFSHPCDFDDSTDSTLNNDIEEELEELKNDPDSYIKRIAKQFIVYFASELGFTIDESLISDTLPLLKHDGSFNESSMRQYLNSKMPHSMVDKCISTLKKNNSIIRRNQHLKQIEQVLEHYLGLNKRLTQEVYAFSLAEEGDNQAMWSLYGDEGKGFCIEYQFPINTFLGQRMLCNLFPIYYGKKPLINFSDVIIKGLFAKNTVNGIRYEDYQEWFVSAYTKDEKFLFQKEWRITFDRDLGHNLQDFPFVKSIILGEKMTQDHKNKLIEIAKKKNLSVYERTFNISGSKIVTKKIL